MTHASDDESEGEAGRRGEGGEGQGAKGRRGPSLAGRPLNVVMRTT